MRKSVLAVSSSFAVLGALSSGHAQGQARETAHSLRPQAPGLVKELGIVSFYRDLDAVLAQARKSETSKPHFLLFQEIPG